jgi:hypothetical protein
MLNILLSIACFVTFKAAFLRLFASRRTHTEQASAQKDQVVHDGAQIMKEFQTNTH